MKKTFLVLLVTLCTITLYAQENFFMYGNVFNKLDKKPLAYVTVYTTNHKHLGTITNDEGHFIIKNIPKGNHTLHIEFLGYKTLEKKITVTGNLNLGNLYLAENVEALDAVVVRAQTSTITQKIDRLVVNVGKDLVSVGTDAASVLNNVQSVSVDSQTGELSLRGNTNVTVMIDGKISNIPTEQLIQQIPSNAIKNIEIITNPSAKYNPEGKSGIINIELIKNDQKGFNGNVNLSEQYSRNLRSTFGANLNYKTKNINWFTNYNVNTGKRNILGEIRRTSSFQETDGLDDFTNQLIKFGADIDFSKKLSTSITTTQQWNNLDYRNAAVLSDFKGGTPSLNSLFEFNRQNRNQGYDVSTRKIFDNKKHYVELRVNYNLNSSPQNSTNSESINPANQENNYTENIFQNNYRFITNLDYTKPLKNEGDLETGIEFRKYNSANKNTSNQLVTDSNNASVSKGASSFDLDRYIYSAYVNIKQQYGKFGFQSGLRTEYYDLKANFKADLDQQNQDVSNQKFSVYPSLFTTYQITTKDQIAFNYSRRVDRPSIKQLTPIRTWSTPLLLSLGNPNLVQEFTNSYELKYLKNLKNGDVSITTFYRDIQHFISRTLSTDLEVPDRLILSYGNFDQTNNYGLEMSWYYKPTTWWSFNASADSYFQKQQGYLNNTPTKVNNIQVNQRMNHTFLVGEKTSLQLTSLFRGQEKNIQRTRKNMFMLSSGASYKCFDDKGSLSVTFNDLLNTFKIKFYSFNPIYQNGFFNPETRAVTVSFNYNFGQKIKTKKTKNPEDKEGGDDTF